MVPGRYLVCLCVSLTLATFVQGFKAPDERIKVETSRRRSNDGSNTAAGIDWNKAVDTILAITQKDILQQGIEEVSLPDCREDFEHKVGFFTVKGSFLAVNGKLGNITSFRRSEDVSAVVEGNTYRVESVFSLGMLRVRYANYKLNVLGLEPKGFLEGTVDSNSIHATLKFESRLEGCVSTLERLKVTGLGGVTVRVSGFGPLDRLASDMATWVIEQRKKDIVADIERVLTSEIRRILKDFACDENASLLMF